jgi:hypothetical protein
MLFGPPLRVMSAAAALVWLGGGAMAAPPPRPVNGEFERADAGAGIACRVTAHGTLSDDIVRRMGPQPCLHIGDVSVGDSRQRVEQVIGPPDGTPVKQQGEFLEQIYRLRAADPAEPRVPFYAVTYRFGTVATEIVSDVQLTGPRAEPPIAFTGIRLGDPPAAVTARLGEPARREPVPADGAELWVYEPYQVSFEIKDGVVYSIKLAYRPAGK